MTCNIFIYKLHDCKALMIQLVMRIIHTTFNNRHSTYVITCLK